MITLRGLLIARVYGRVEPIGHDDAVTPGTVEPYGKILRPRVATWRDA